VTAELARRDPTLPAVTSDPGLLARRLDRLRAGGRLAAAAAPTSPPPGRAVHRAERLALAVGGRLEDGPAGPVCLVRSEVRLPLAAERLAALPYPIEPWRPLVCLDTETTGLGTAAGTLVFLVGFGLWRGDRFVVSQLLLADQPDERAFLAALAAALPSDAWLVTYNGRGFDWPLLTTRYRLAGRPPPPHAGHLDLLPVARQLWRHRLADARLASVEAGICGVRRSGDLPGELIPERYFGYLRTGRGELLADVLEHNRQDVVSLALMLAELSRRLAGAEGRAHAHPGDLAGLGRAFYRRRRFDEALACYETAIERCRERVADGWQAPETLDALLAERARVLARLGRRHEAAAVWQVVAEHGGPHAMRAWLQLAKHREHQERDMAAALAAAERAQIFAERARRLGRAAWWVERDLARRMARLRRRAA
jgi:tetratricopeptide (TPR) repeat protein